MSAFNTLINDNSIVLVDFHARWCAPCRVLSPEIDKVAKNMGTRLKVTKIDIDKHNKIARRYHIYAVPTLTLFKDGKIIWRKSGILSSKQIENEINKFL